jgi:hypothetical protein
MDTAPIIDAAMRLATTFGNTGAGPWGHFTCHEIDEIANLMITVDRRDVATALILHHSDSDTTADGGEHTEIGDAVRAEADLRDVAFTARESYKLAAAYLAAWA